MVFLQLAISSSLLFTARFCVEIGLSIITFICPLLKVNDLFGNTFPAPMIVIGTIGSLVWIANVNPPFLNGSKSPVSERVPSGYMRVENDE